MQIPLVEEAPSTSDERIFAVMERNAVHVSDFFSIPSNQVVEIGRQVAI